MKFKEWINIIIILLLLSISFFRFRNKTYTASKIRFLMDTQVEISIISKNQNVDKLLDNAFDIIEKYDEMLSYFNPNSFLYHLNHSDSLQTKINEDIYEILKLAELVYYRSNNLYDISIAPLVDIWDFSNEIIPTSEMIELSQKNVGFDRIDFDENYIYLPVDMKINLGSISKGYIIDKTIEYIADKDVVEVFINAGGDIRFFSHNKKKWRLGIQHPRDRLSTIVVLRIPDMAVVTSGDYERYFIQDGVRYHHILNPKTGFPASPTVAVTIFSPTAFLADALSTAAFVMNPFDAIEMIKSFPDTEGIIFFYDSDGQPISLKTTGTRSWIISDVNEF
ncbi:MAG: FAD:protein FMN transferase [Candidatus Cloacimonetes bacterium]|nr:FAD:protein FMN transferase [Candidatus Cloacimonadota bacterium]